VEANSTGGQGSRRAVAPSDDDDEYEALGSNLDLETYCLECPFARDFLLYYPPNSGSVLRMK
jgi:hypothetical protein